VSDSGGDDGSRITHRTHGPAPYRREVRRPPMPAIFINAGPSSDTRTFRRTIPGIQHLPTPLSSCATRDTRRGPTYG
jgi:hypothetical protein